VQLQKLIQFIEAGDFSNIYYYIRIDHDRVILYQILEKRISFKLIHYEDCSLALSKCSLLPLLNEN